MQQSLQPAQHSYVTLSVQLGRAKSAVLLKALHRMCWQSCR